MTRRFWIALAVLLLLIPGFMFVASCAKKQIPSEPGVSLSEEEAKAKRLAAMKEAAEARKAMEEERLREERLGEEARAQKEREELAARDRFINEHIHFEFDKSRLLPRAKEVLRNNAKWLLAHTDVEVTIEGHCDERGTNAYNIALGDRRAKSTKGYLVDLGVDPDRLATISYGEERPLDTGHNEAAWAKNRRAQFVID
jgi:peptidoglycan-associated lipoprotein